MSKDIKQVYNEICLGYSKDIWKNSNIYIKHFSNLDLIEVDSIYNQSLEESKKKGILSYSEKIKWLIEKKLWSDDREIEINQQQDFIDGLILTNEKLIFPSQKRENEKILREETGKLNLLLYEKDRLLGTTSEKIANQKIQFYYIYISFFKNKELSENFFSLEDINNLDDEESDKLLSFYMQIIGDFDIKNIKKISISYFFINNFYICGENMQSFFGKPIYLLTNYQSSLLSYGSYFKNVFSTNPDIPKNIKDDPEKIEEFIKQGQNLKHMLSKIDSNAQSVGIPATKQDFEELGLIRDTNILNSKGPSMEK